MRTGSRLGGRALGAGIGIVALCTATLPLAACGPFGAGGTTASTSITTSSASPSVTDGPTAATPSATASRSSTPTGTAVTSPATSGGSSQIATMSGGNGLARRLVLGTGAVPAGWQVAAPRDSGGYRMTICGVDIEPNAPVDGAQKRWQQTATGPFLEQHVRVYGDKTAATVVERLRRAVPGCSSYTATDASGGSGSYRVSQLPVAGTRPGTVSWRQSLRLPGLGSPTGTSGTSTPTPAASGPLLIQDVAVTRKGSSVVLLASYSVNVTPQPQVLTTAVAALNKIP